MERQKMKKKGFTLVELLVVIAIIAMLLAILMPALGKVRQMAQRLICGTNIAGVGKTMLVYSNDDRDESYPIAGTSATIWDLGTGGNEGACTWDWSNKATPGSPTNSLGANKSTISACLYLLVKYADVSPDQFICPGGSEKKFELNHYNLTTTDATIADVWDFGSGASGAMATGFSRGRGHSSYSYQLPFKLADTGTGDLVYPISTTSNPSKAILADRNPFWEKSRTDEGLMTWLTTNPAKVDPGTHALGNATPHQKDGQNVLYADSHVKFEKSANCGIERDNIYTTWGVASLPTGQEDELRQIGGTTPPNQSVGVQNWAQSEEDSYLVNDYN